MDRLIIDEIIGFKNSFLVIFLFLVYVDFLKFLII